MSKVSNDILSYYGIAEELEFLMHYGVGPDDNPPGRGSGRFPKGSGDNPNQHVGREFYDQVVSMRKAGMDDKKIAEELGLYDIYGNPSTGLLRDVYRTAKNRVRIDNYNKAIELKEKGYSNQKIADELGLSGESAVRSLFNKNSHEQNILGQRTADQLKDILKEKGPLDIGAGAEAELSIALGVNISEERLREALYILEEEGYVIENVRTPQPTNPGQKTTIRLLAEPGTDVKTLRRDYSNWNSITNYISPDGGDTIQPLYEYPASLDPKRLMIRYSEDGGEAKDGLIELRRGVDDLSLGQSNYAQVRILVDGTHYIKGMAAYSDNLPEGIDIVFNTNKSKSVPALGPDKENSVLKPIKKDPENPFGSLIKDSDEGGQYHYIDKETGEDKLGLINKTREEGDWETWKDKLPAQFLSKQPQKLIDNQLNLSVANKRAEYEEICSLTNPTLKKKLLLDFAGKCDTAAVDLKAASLPGQKYHVLMPMETLKSNECYAPNYEDGTMLALVRFPHAGPFEIPVVRVNNSYEEGKNMLGPNAIDAIGISHDAAKKLSGADFDGDTAIAIPITDNVRIQSEPVHRLLRDFDPQMEYARRDGMKEMTKNNTQREMGIISNLITDMYTQGASSTELAYATRHSMVVIDAEKHGLDYKRSEEENHIEELKQKYQDHKDGTGKYGGASTIISRAKSDVTVDKRQGAPRINEDGTVWYKKADDLYYIDKHGEKKTRKQQVSAMSETDDAFTLVSNVNSPVERAYATYANTMKDIAKQARAEAVKTKDISYSKDAYLAYKSDIDILLDQVNEAERNRPRERLATAKANAVISKKMAEWREDNPSASKSEYNAEKKKISQKAMSKARREVGAARKEITLTDRQWDAINQGAVHKTTLEKIFKYANMDAVRQRALPHTNNELGKAAQARIRQMSVSGYTTNEIAKQLGVSTSTVVKYMKGVHS